MKMKFICAVSILALMATSCGDDDDDKGKSPNLDNDISEKVSIERDTYTKEATLAVDVNGEWKLYAGSTAEGIDLTTPVLTGKGKGEHTVNVSNTARSYFKIISDEGQATFAERRLPIDSCYHFRDMGGYKTTDGKIVKWGKVFRTDELIHVSDGALAYLNGLPLKTIVDFRSITEAAMGQQKLPASVINIQDLNISIGNLTEILLGMGAGLATITREEIIELMSDMYRDFVTEEECIEQFKALFGLLQNEGNLPLAYNCSIGKDRTGIASFLFLTSLGVSEDVAIGDYQLTDSYNVASKYEKYTSIFPGLKPLFEANPDFIKAAIDQIKKDNGSVENFLTNKLNVDLAKMKSIYLY